MSTQATQVDLHCHSTASQTSKLGIQRSLGIPECATSPAEVYELAKRRGMQFVTITDHDTIAGCLELSDRPDAFVSEELTAWFRGEPQAVHILCYGITPDDHARLQERSHDLEACAQYLHENQIVCSLAHPYFDVEAELSARHRHILAELFSIWETRNGSRPQEQNAMAQSHIDISQGTGTGGSDDHAGVDIGKTYTETPPAASWQEFLSHVASGAAHCGGEHGSPAKSAHAALALASRSLGCAANGERVTARTCMRLAAGVVEEGTARSTRAAGDLDRGQAQKLLETWYRSVGLSPADGQLISHLQSGELSHASLYRRARRAHERRVKDTVSALTRWLADPSATGGQIRPETVSLDEIATNIIEAIVAACTPALPYAPAEVFAAQERARMQHRERDRLRVGLVVDGIGAMHGVTRTISELRDRGVEGADVDVIGTDPEVDHRLSSAIDIDIPFYDGLQVGVPTVTAVVEALVAGNYDLVHLTSPGPANLIAAAVCQVMGLSCVASYHTELGEYASLRSGDPRMAYAMNTVLGHLYSRCNLVLSPSPSADRSLVELGISPEAIQRWDRGVDLTRFTPTKRKQLGCPGAIRVLYAGRLAREKGTELLAEAFLKARGNRQDLQLLVAGRGPDEAQLRSRLGDAATFFGWLDQDQLAELYASADIFVFPSTTDTFGQVVLEAQASGLPVIAANAGGPASLISHGVNGLLCEPQPDCVSSQIELAAADLDLRRRLSTGGLANVEKRSWEAALRQLAAGYRSALEPAAEAELVHA